MSKYTLFFIYFNIVSYTTVLQLSKRVQKDAFIGQLIHNVEIVQFQAMKKVSIWLKSLWSYIENLLKSIVLLFSKSLENHIDMV